MFSTLTPGYPSTSRLHQSSSAFVPRRSPIASLWVVGWFSVGSWEMEERPRLELVLSFQLKEGRSCFIIRVNSDRVDHLFLDLFLGKPRESPGEMNQCNSQRE